MVSADQATIRSVSRSMSAAQSGRSADRAGLGQVERELLRPPALLPGVPPEERPFCPLGALWPAWGSIYAPPASLGCASIGRAGSSTQDRRVDSLMRTAGERRMLVSEFTAPSSMPRPRPRPALVSLESSAFDAVPGA